MAGIRIPVIRDLENAIRMYYSLYELRTTDIKALFGGISSGRAKDLKEYAKRYVKENGLPELNASTVDTEAAFKAWGLDISNLEMRHRKLMKLDKETYRYREGA